MDTHRNARPRSLVPHALAVLGMSLLASTARGQATVPDLDLVANPKTLAQVQTAYGSQWSNFIVVAEMVGTRATTSTLVRQEPDPGSLLTAGQLMHLYVGASEGEESSGPIGKYPFAQWLTIAVSILGIFCFFSRFFPKRG